MNALQQVRARRELLLAEEEKPQKRRLGEEREEALHRERDADDAARRSR